MKKLFFFCLLSFVFCLSSNAQITWAEGQLLPSFPTPANPQDLIMLRPAIDGQPATTDEDYYLFSSLKGIINRTQPRIFSYEGDCCAEGKYTWLNSLNISYTERSPYTLITKYRSEIRGLIVYDPDQLHTVNLATMLAKDSAALIAAPSLLTKLTAAPYNLPILLDLRGQFSNKLSIYQYIFDNLWDKTDKRLIIGLDPVAHKSSLREYAVATGETVIWLNPKTTAESTLLNKFLASMPDGASYTGWFPEEEPGVTRLSQYGMALIASDYCTNLTFHSGFPRQIDAKPIPAKPTLQNKIYVAFIISDGDNLQYVEHRMRLFWSNSDRGSVPIGWTISPAMVDAMPGALNYFHASSTENDNLISGPSGFGYTYPNKWSGVISTKLPAFIEKTEEYNVAAGIRVITVWNEINGGINTTVGQRYAQYAPTLLGVTAQNTDGTGTELTLASQSLPVKRLNCNYCTGEQAMKDHINSASNGWNGNEPRFLIIQGNPWNSEINPTGFKNIKNYFSQGTYAGKYVFVRPDHIFQLIREANGLPINPGSTTGTGEGLTANYYNGTNFETKIAERIDSVVNFNWGSNSPMENVNNENFTVRWTGQIEPSFSGNHTFYLTTSQGVKLWINNELIIDKWTGRNSQTYTAKVLALTVGEKYDIKLEFLKSRGAATCRLEWASPMLSREVVPQSQLYKDISQSGFGETNAFANLRVFAKNGVLNIIANENLTINSVEIYDIIGKFVETWRATSQQMGNVISHLPKGIYLAKIKSDKGTITKKFVIE